MEFKCEFKYMEVCKWMVLLVGSREFSRGPGTFV